MDRCVTLVALISALAPLTLAVYTAQGGGVRKEPTVSCSLRFKGNHKKARDFKPQPHKHAVCRSVITHPSSDDTNAISPINVTSSGNAILTRWIVPRKVSVFVMHVTFVTEDNKPSEECHQFHITGNAAQRKRRRRIDCTYIKSDKVTKGRQFNFAIFREEENVPTAAGAFDKKTKNNGLATTTKIPMGCYNWRPNTITVLPNSTDVAVTWFPPFKESGFEISLFDVQAEEIAQNKEFASWETRGVGITEYTFHDVTPGRYEARIKPTGCIDCPDYDFNGRCYSDLTASETVNVMIAREENSEPVQTSVGCYNWRPQSFVLRPSNTDVIVTWSPAFATSGLEIALYDKENGEIIDHKEFPSWKTARESITEHTFHNVTAGRYEGRIKPTGCEDCPNFKFDDGCRPDPVASETVNEAVTEAKPGGLVSMVIPQPPYDNSLLYGMAAVTALATFAVFIMAVMCYFRDSICGTKALPYRPNPGASIVTTSQRGHNKGEHSEGDRPRIVVLYGVDHDHHIAAVMSFASLLRRLLDIEVVVEREQGRADTCNIADWLTASLKPPTMVIVVASEALYQLSCQQDVRKRDFMSRVTGDMFSKYSPLALSYLQEQSFSSQPVSQTVLLVSFGYGHGDNSLVKLMDSFRLLFKGVFFEVTEMKNGTRSHNITDLLRCLSADGCAPGVTNNMGEMEQFLSSVDRMDHHIQLNGSAWWENAVDSSSYSSGTTESRNNSRLFDLDIDTETFSVFSEMTASSAVTVNLLCKRCCTSSCHTLPSGFNGTARVSTTLSDDRPAVWDSSCLTLHMPEMNEDNISDVFISEASENTALLNSSEGLKIEDFEESVVYDSENQIPDQPLNELGSRSSSVSVEIAGREC